MGAFNGEGHRSTHLLQALDKVTDVKEPVSKQHEAQLALPGLEPSPQEPASTDTAPSETSLFDTTFVVLDLETTGMSPINDAITEIGAVKVKRGELLGEFATFVRPTKPIPPSIERLTGISNRDVANAPSLASVFPSFLEFIKGSTLVAHNAAFDISFLQNAARNLDYEWPDNPTLCTVKLSRRILDRQEAPSVKLSALAQIFKTSQQPTHRALDDARTTVEVLHGLIERVGGLDVTTLRDLQSYKSDLNNQVYRKRHLADKLPHRPGVYIFYDRQDHPLYIGTATDLRSRVGSYFNGSETRSRMTEMVLLAQRIDYVECLTSFEASIQELRLIRALRPPYNRRSKNQKAQWWLVPASPTSNSLYQCKRRKPASTQVALGPFPQRRTAATLAQVLHNHVRHGLAPTDPIDNAQQQAALKLLSQLARGNSTNFIPATLQRINELAEQHRYEQAALLRDEGATAIHSLARYHQHENLKTVSELIAAEKDGRKGWYFTIIRHGIFAGVMHCASGESYKKRLQELKASGQTVDNGDPASGIGSEEERHLVYRYLTSGHLRLVEVSDPWAEGNEAAGKYLEWAEQARQAKK